MAEFEAQKDATASLHNLKRADLKELKAFVHPPPIVQLVLNAVLVVLGKEPNWKNAQSLLASPSFFHKLNGLNINTLKASTMKRLAVYVQNKELSVEAVNKASRAAACLWAWVLGVYNTYMKIATTIWANQRSVLSSDVTTTTSVSKSVIVKKRRTKKKKKTKTKEKVEQQVDNEKLEEGLDRIALNELKALVRPPSYVLLVMEAVLVVFGEDPTWKNAQRLLGSQNFVKMLKELDVNTLKASTMKKLAVYVQNEELSIEAVESSSRAAAWLWAWVLGVYKAYMEIAKAIWANQRSVLSSDATTTASKSETVIVKKKRVKKKILKKKKKKAWTESQLLGKSLNRNTLMELKTFVRPSAIIQLVMEAILTMLEEETTWKNAQRLLGSPAFLKKLQELDINNLNDNTMETLGVYVHHPSLSMETVRKASLAAAVLWQWLVGICDIYERRGDDEVA